MIKHMMKYSWQIIFVIKFMNVLKVGSFDIWCDFTLINPGAFNASFKILIKYLSITNSEKENKDLENDNTFPLDEEEDFK